jgi:PHD/YefM family antitoxin component YafN of YafNO toxin-antitoxin module
MNRALPCSERAHMLDAMEKTISMAQLAKNAEQIARDIETTGTTYRIKRPGRKKLMLIDDRYFERWAAMIELKLLHPNLEEELAQSRRDYEAGLFVPLEQVIAERGLADNRRLGARKTAVRRSPRSRRNRRR